MSKTIKSALIFSLSFPAGILAGIATLAIVGGLMGFLVNGILGTENSLSIGITMTLSSLLSFAAIAFLTTKKFKEKSYLENWQVFLTLPVAISASAYFYFFGAISDMPVPEEIPRAVWIYSPLIFYPLFLAVFNQKNLLS
jgi:hypothetical protein